MTNVRCITLGIPIAAGVLYPVFSLLISGLQQKSSDDSLTSFRYPCFLSQAV